MERAAAVDAFTRGLRLVLQKHEREVEARAEVKEARRLRTVFSPLETEYLKKKLATAEAALQEANTNLDAAIDQFADVCLSLPLTPE
jgi:hypothetical protein